MIEETSLKDMEISGEVYLIMMVLIHQNIHSYMQVDLKNRNHSLQEFKFTNIELPKVCNFEGGCPVPYIILYALIHINHESFSLKISHFTVYMYM